MRAAIAASGGNGETARRIFNTARLSTKTERGLEDIPMHHNSRPTT